MYREIYREINGTDAPKPIIAAWVACHEDRDVAEDMYKTYITRYSRSALEHYEFDKAKLTQVKGYAYYGALANNKAQHGNTQFIDFMAQQKPEENGRGKGGGGNNK